MRPILAAALLALLPVLSAADRPAPNREHTITSANELFMAVVTPATTNYQDQNGTTTVSRAAADGTPGEVLYTAAFFAWDVKLSDDGEVLVHTGPWARDSETLSDRAIAVWRRSVKVADFKVSDFVKDKSRISKSVSHYSWQGESSTIPVGFSQGGKLYTLAVCDRRWYTVDTTTGKIAAEGTAEDALTDRYKMELEMASERELVLGQFNATGAADAWNARYVSEGNPHTGGAVYGCDLPDPHWLNDFTPRHPELRRTMLELILSVEDERLAMTADPVRMEETLLALVRIPYLKKHLDAAPGNRLRWRASGDRFAWGESRINEVRIPMEEAGISTPAWNEWCELILDLENREMLRVLHPLGTECLVIGGSDVGLDADLLSQLDPALVTAPRNLGAEMGLPEELQSGFPTMPASVKGAIVTDLNGTFLHHLPELFTEPTKDW